MDREGWHAAVRGVTKSQTQLKESDTTEQLNWSFSRLISQRVRKGQHHHPLDCWKSNSEFHPMPDWRGIWTNTAKWRQNRLCLGFPGSSANKESACNAGDPGLAPGLGRSPGEGIGYPHQFSQASLVAQMVKNPPAVTETWIRFLGWEDPLEEGMTTHPVFLLGESPWTEEPSGLHSMESQRIRHNWATKHSTEYV